MVALGIHSLSNCRFMLVEVAGDLAVQFFFRMVPLYRAFRKAAIVHCGTESHRHILESSPSVLSLCRRNQQTWCGGFVARTMGKCVSPMCLTRTRL